MKVNDNSRVKALFMFKSFRKKDCNSEYNSRNPEILIEKREKIPFPF